MTPPEPEEWQIDGEEFLLNPVFEPEPEPSQPTVVVRQQDPHVERLIQAFAYMNFTQQSQPHTGSQFGPSWPANGH